MRVLLVTKPHLPILGGGQVTVHWLALALLERGHAVEVLSHQRPLHPQPPEDRELGYLALRPERPELELPGALARLEPDVVVVNAFGDEALPWARGMLAVPHELPTVLYLHDAGGVPLLGEPGRRPELVLAVSRFVAEQARGYGHAVAPLAPIVEPGRYRVESSREVALFVTPHRVKGLELMLALARARPDVPFAFQRCWPSYPDVVAELVREVAPIPNVELREALLEPRAIYRDARVVLVPSAYPEGFGRVAAEARVSALPVIAAERGGLPEAAGPGAVLVAPGAGLDGWAAALAALWDDPAAYRRRVSELEAAEPPGELSAAAVALRFEQLVQPVVGVEKALPG